MILMGSLELVKGLACLAAFQVAAFPVAASQVVASQVVASMVEVEKTQGFFPQNLGPLLANLGTVWTDSVLESPRLYQK